MAYFRNQKFSNLLLNAFIAGFVICASGSAEANFLKKVTHAVGAAVTNVVKAAPAVVAPVPIIAVKVFQGEKPADAAKDVVKDHVEILITPAEVQAQSEAAIVDEVKQHVAAIGPAVEVLQIPDKLQKEAIVETGKMAEHVVETGKVGDVVGAPLATAVREAHQHYVDSAKPIPDKVRFWLSRVYTPDVLDDARYVVDKDFGNLAAILNGISEISGANHAVTLANIIVFSVEPNSDDVWWWGHEMEHTVQYKLLGIDGFAARYSLHWKDMENEANAMGDKTLAEANTVIRFKAAQK